MTIAQERDGRVRSVGDGEQRAGGVLVEHAGLVDEQDIAGEQACACLGCRVGLRPAAVVVPAVAVLVDEPGGGEGVGPDLLLRRLGGLEDATLDRDKALAERIGETYDAWQTSRSSE